MDRSVIACSRHIYMGVILHAHPVRGEPSPTGGLSPPQTKLQAPPNWNMKHYKSVEFLSIFRMSSPPHRNAKPPIENFLATVLGEQRNANREVATVLCVYDLKLQLKFWGVSFIHWKQGMQHNDGRPKPEEIIGNAKINIKEKWRTYPQIKQHK